jgi:A-kinase anchor protein 1
MIVAVPIMNGWYRGLIVELYENNECEIKFVDYGGYSRLATSSLRQIRVDFMTLPFQAAECFLADIKPASKDGWTAEANRYFEELAQGQILQTVVSNLTEDGSYLVQLYKVQGVSDVYVNEELVKHGFAQWLE